MEKFNEKFKQVLFCSVSGRGAAISRFFAGKLARCMRLGDQFCHAVQPLRSSEV